MFSMFSLFSQNAESRPVEARQDTLALLDKHVSHIFVGEEELDVILHLSDQASAELLTNALRQDSRVITSWWKGIPSALQCCSGYADHKLCHAISLDASQFDGLFGKGSYQILCDFSKKYQKAKTADVFLSFRDELLKIAGSREHLYQQLIRLRKRDTYACLLQIALCHETADICTALINYATPAALNQVVPQQDSTGWNSLKVALQFQPPDVSRKLIRYLDDSVLHAALFLPIRDKSSAFSIALKEQSPKMCALLVSRLTTTVLGKALSRLDDGNWPLIMLAAWNQPESVFTAIISKSSSKDLAAAVCQYHVGDGESTFEVAAQYQTHAAVQKLLQHVSTDEAKSIIHAFFSGRTINLIKSFKQFALYQSIQNTDMFLALLDSKQQESLFSHYEDHSKTSEIRFVLRALKYKLSQSSLTSSRVDTLLKLINPLDERRRNKIKEEKQIWREAPVEQDALKKFQKGAFVKIIRHDKDKVHEEFISHLAHPEIRHVVRKIESQEKQGYKALVRPKLREEKEGKITAVYTYPGGFPSVVKARSPEERKQHKLQKKPYTLSTKHPVTYVSSQLNAGLFGFHAGREMVGYAFTVNQQNIRLLMTQDSGTYERWWYGDDLNDLYGNIGHRYNILCQTFAEFEKRINEQPYVVNEVLVKLGLQDLFAIIIAKDTLAARKIAIEHRLEHCQRFQKELPILFYDPEYQDAHIYTAMEQRHDFPELFLAELKKTLEIFFTPKSYSFFVKIAFTITDASIRIDYQDYAISKESARKILDIIAKHEKTPTLAFDEIISFVSSPVVSVPVFKQVI